MVPSSADQRALRQFAADSSAGRVQPIEAYLPSAAEPSYLATLEELVCLEQAKAFARDPSSAAVVERYIERFPVLDDPAIGLRLVRHEFLLRCQHGTPPETSEYRTRFPRWIATGDELMADEPAWQTVSTSPAAELSSDAALVTRTVDSSAPADMRDLVPQGETPSRRYTLTRLHAEGGLGRVWLAHDSSLNRDVALKELRPQQAGRSDACRRFLQERRSPGNWSIPTSCLYTSWASDPAAHSPSTRCDLFAAERYAAKWLPTISSAAPVKTTRSRSGGCCRPSSRSARRSRSLIREA